MSQAEYQVPRGYSPRLTNADLAPTTPAQRRWGAFSIFNVWTSDVHSLWGYFLALVRAIVACFWYGAQTAAASGAIVALLTRSDAMMAFHKDVHVLGHSGLEVICYVVVWALQLLI